MLARNLKTALPALGSTLLLLLLASCGPEPVTEPGEHDSARLAPIAPTAMDLEPSALDPARRLQVELLCEGDISGFSCRPAATSMPTWAIVGAGQVELLAGGFVHEEQDPIGDLQRRRLRGQVTLINRMDQTMAGPIDVYFASGPTVTSPHEGTDSVNHCVIQEAPFGTGGDAQYYRFAEEGVLLLPDDEDGLTKEWCFDLASKAPDDFAYSFAILVSTDIHAAGELEIDIAGRLERSSIVTASLTLDGEPLAANTAAWTADPPDAVLMLGDDRFELLVAGDVTLTAQVDDSTAHVELHVAVPPTILFQRFVSRAWRLYRVELDGEALEQVVAGDGREPASAGGTIVFVSDREGIPAVYSLESGETTPARLTELDTEHCQPALDDSNSQLAFIRFISSIPKIFIADRDGQGMRRLTAGFGTSFTVEGGPAFSPDGATIVFSSAPGDTPDLFFADVETGEVTAFRTGSDFFLDSAWSPCGRYIAYSARPRTQVQKLDLFLYDLDTGAVVQLTDRDEPDGLPSWLPDGRLLYSATVGDDMELRWMDPFALTTVHTIPTGPERARASVALR